MFLRIIIASSLGRGSGLLRKQEVVNVGHHTTDGGEVNGGAGTDPFGVFSSLQETGNTTNGELKTGLAAPRGGLLGVARS
ncbi:hypothetical protein Ahy_B03g066517 [Arachis hypogaea]|uniref:Uncharacterized protein n=1 Tax=Arachis hypogaea TaxID=3818 RepID=A0A445A457_ARAHY|nr:hypothetical protein Ahy_B03g066517 [Arachis hypogaea]